MNKNKKNLKMFGRLIQYARPYKVLFLSAAFCVVLLSFLSPFRPYLIGNMVDKYIIQNQNEALLLTWSLGIACLLFFEGILQFLSSYFSNLLAQSVIRDLRKKLFKHIVSFRMKYFDKTPVGALVTRVVSDLEAVTQVFSSGIMEISGDLISLTMVLSLMFATNWQLSLMTLIPIPLLIIATKIFAKAMRSSFQLERLQVTKLNTFIQEHLSGMSIVQIFNKNKEEYAKFVDINKGHRRAHINAVWANSIFFPVVEILSSLSIAFLLVWGALRVDGKSAIEIKAMYGQIIAFTLWIYQLYRPIRQLADKFNVLQRGVVRAERIFEILDHETQRQEAGELINVNFNTDIFFNKVSFAYKEGHDVLKEINLKIAKGTTVAIVGSTGAGKSTIVNILGRFYEHQKGEIRIGDVKIEEIQLDYLRKNIAVVLQDIFLFSDTVHNNITLGDKTITRQQVIEASKAVGAHDFISQLPGTYDYSIGERGSVLSVGQRQLLSFIRAYVYNPQVLILDEATSSVDNESEMLIQNATDYITKGRTSIVIAHRMSTIQKADLIVVMEKGEIIESGTHRELIKNKGKYNTLYEKQIFQPR
ncbi:MAG: ABC transporter ATP-binding protein [Crocinitomicaceae bacterium]|jgi:ATP-binding cassette subfamily B protein|tara:strand:+ start:4497 stop:6260 length:1764 start_codon:yes stop_codon:yes gene_type:complete